MIKINIENKGTLPPDVIRILKNVEKNGFEIYLVGGCIRDLLLGTIPKDWDFCTNALPQEILRCFSGFKTRCIGKKYGTIAILWNDTCYEITTYRTDENYQNARKPTKIQFVSNLYEDLCRRDFTINAMAYHPSTGLLDLYEGRSDLQQGLLRTVGNPNKRFSEDAFRILRGIRIAACYNLTFEEETKIAANALAPLLNKISNERILAEFDRFLMAPGDSISKAFYDFYPIWSTLFPELTKNLTTWKQTIQTIEHMPPDLFLRWAVLLHANVRVAPETICNRFHMEKKRTQHICALVQNYDRPIPTKPKDMRRAIAVLGKTIVSQLLQIQYAKNETKNYKALQQAELLLAQILQQKPCFCRKNLAINGYDLLAIGIEKGPRIGAVQKRLLQLVIDEVLPNQKEILLKYAMQLKSMPLSVLMHPVDLTLNSNDLDMHDTILETPHHFS